MCDMYAMLVAVSITTTNTGVLEADVLRKVRAVRNKSVLRKVRMVKEDSDL